MTITGTSHFVSMKAARDYYRDYGYDDVIKAVQRKLNEGEIHIGKPVAKPGQRVIMIDNGQRYAIEEE